MCVPSCSSHCQSTPRTTLALGKIPRAAIFLLFLLLSTATLQAEKERKRERERRGEREREREGGREDNNYKSSLLYKMGELKNKEKCYVARQAINTL